MTSPGGPARLSGPVPGAAGTDRSVTAAPEPPAAGETLRPVPDPAADPAGDAVPDSDAPTTGPAPAVTPVPPHRPVPPTFPSPGQPPPGVARRHGRHAKPERTGAAVHTPPTGYRPRHAAPDAETEQFAATPATGPGGSGPLPLGGLAGTAGAAGAPPDGSAPAPASGAALHTGPGVVVPRMAEVPDVDGRSDRVRVVLAERRVPTRAVRTVAEIEQQTETGELLLRNLLRAQLALGLRLGLVAVFVLGALPVLFLVLPRAGSVEIAGVTLPWLVLGLLPYPFILALAWLYTRTAERNELDFADNVED